MDYGGFKIPKDMVVVYPIRKLHMDPEVYPEPEKFKPERYRLTLVAHHPFSSVFIHIFGALLNTSGAPSGGSIWYYVW